MKDQNWNLGKKILAASAMLVFVGGFSPASHATGGKVYCLGVEMPSQSPAGEGLIEELVDCTYRVARAKAALRGERNVKVSNYQYISNDSEPVNNLEEAFYRLAKVSVSSSKGEYVETITLEGLARSKGESDDVEIYVNEVESALGIKLKQ